MVCPKQIKKIEESFEKGYAPGGVPISTDKRLRNLHPSETSEKHLEIIMISYCTERYKITTERAIELGGNK